MKNKINKDADLIEASKHYAIAECGRLARISTPYPMNARTKMGVGFDYFNGYFKFYHRHEKGGELFSIKSHRMIYFIHHQTLPECVDHIDRDTTNNEISNLRAATVSQNNTNRRSAKNSSSKYLGVCWHKAMKKWSSKIRVNKVVKHLGYFMDEVGAAKAYNSASTKYHGEFANLNKL